MSDKKRIKYLTKVVKFGGKDLTLYSIDGVTWSSKKNELLEIQDRHEKQRAALQGLKPEVEEEPVDKEAKEEEKEESDVEVVIDEDIDIDYEEDDEEDDSPKAKKGKSPPAKDKPPKGKAAPKKPAPVKAKAAKPSAKKPTKPAGKKKR